MQIEFMKTHPQPKENWNYEYKETKVDMNLATFSTFKLVSSDAVITHKNRKIINEQISNIQILVFHIPFFIFLAKILDYLGNT